MAFSDRLPSPEFLRLRKLLIEAARHFAPAASLLPLQTMRAHRSSPVASELSPRNRAGGSDWHGWEIG